MNKEDWDDLRIVLAVARAGSFAQAAKVLSVNESTVARKVTSAEQRLNARLFDRKHGTISLTEAGRELMIRAERIEAVFQDATDSIRDADRRVAGTVRVTAMPLLINHILIPLLPELLGQYPGLEVELVSDTGALSLARRETDIALRLARPVEGARVVTRKVGELPYAVYGRRDLDSQRLPWLSFERGTGVPSQVEWSARQVLKEGPLSTVRVSDGESLVACIQAGLGRALLPAMVGDRTPGLSRLDGGRCQLTRELWLVVHPDLRKLDRVRVVMDWLTQVCADLTEGQIFVPSLLQSAALHLCE